MRQRLQHAPDAAGSTESDADVSASGRSEEWKDERSSSPDDDDEPVLKIPYKNIFGGSLNWSESYGSALSFELNMDLSYSKEFLDEWKKYNNYKDQKLCYNRGG